MRDNKAKSNDFTNISSLTTQIMLGVVVGIVSVLIFAIGSAFLVEHFVISTFFVSLLASLTLFFGALVGGYKAARGYGKNGMFVGMIVGIIFLPIVILTGILFETFSFEVFDLSLLFTKIFGLMLFGAVGGILGINLKF